MNANINNNSELFRAIYADDIDRVKECLDKHPNWLHINNQENQKSPLTAASMMNHAEIVKLLISRGSKVDEVDGNEDTALLVAAHFGHSEVIVSLIKEKAESNKCNKAGRSPLMIAAYYGHTACVEYFIHAGAKLDIKDALGHTALFYCIWENGLESARLLMGAGASISEKQLAKNKNNRNTQTIMAVQGMLKAREEALELHRATQSIHLESSSDSVLEGDKQAGGGRKSRKAKPLSL